MTKVSCSTLVVLIGLHITGPMEFILILVFLIFCTFYTVNSFSCVLQALDAHCQIWFLTQNLLSTTGVFLHLQLIEYYCIKSVVSFFFFFKCCYCLTDIPEISVLRDHTCLWDTSVNSKRSVRGTVKLSLPVSHCACLALLTSGWLTWLWRVGFYQKENIYISFRFNLYLQSDSD